MSPVASGIISLIWWGGGMMWLHTWKNSERGSALAVAVVYFIIATIYAVMAISA